MFKNKINNTYYTMDEINEQIGQLNLNIEEVYSKKYEIDMISKKNEEKFDLHSKQIFEINKNDKQLFADIKILQNKVNNKTNVSETQRLWEEFKNYAAYTDLKDLYSKVMPQLKSFEQTIVEVTRKQEQSTEMIRRYDEVITTKANKVVITEIYEYFTQFLLKDLFYSNMDAATTKLTKLDKELTALDKYTKVLYDTIQKEIYTLVKRAMGPMKAQI